MNQGQNKIGVSTQIRSLDLICLDELKNTISLKNGFFHRLRLQNRFSNFDSIYPFKTNLDITKKVLTFCFEKIKNSPKGSHCAYAAIEFLIGKVRYAGGGYCAVLLKTFYNTKSAGFIVKLFQVAKHAQLHEGLIEVLKGQSHVEHTESYYLCVQQLLKSFCRIKVPHTEGANLKKVLNQAVFRAVRKAKTEQAIALLEAGAEQYQYCHPEEGYAGHTLLQVAVLCQTPEQVQSLLEYGLDPNYQDAKGKIPLHLACEQSNFKMAEILLDGLSEPLTKDNQNKYPQDYVKKFKDEFEVLFKLYVDPNHILEDRVPLPPPALIAIQNLTPTYSSQRAKQWLKQSQSTNSPEPSQPGQEVAKQYRYGKGREKGQFLSTIPGLIRK